MDWAKAKSILIIALLAVCLILGGILCGRSLLVKENEKKVLNEVKDYLNSIGVKTEVEIPKERPALPVLFVEYDPQGVEENNPEYAGYRICANGMDVSGYSVIREGEKKARVSGSWQALLEVVYESGINFDENFSDGDNIRLQINDIELVYFIDNMYYSDPAGSSDTAIPAWRIDTSEGMFYINAYR